MSQKLKTLQEQRGAKLKEITDLNASVSGAFNDEQRQKFDALEKDIQGLDGDIQREMRMQSEQFRKAPEVSKQEDRDLARFDIGKVLRHMDKTFRGQVSKLDGIEGELVAQAADEARASGIELRGIGLPQVLLRRANLAEQRDLSVTGGTTTQYGGDLVATDKLGLLDDFYKRSVMISGGALVLNGLVGNVDLPRYTKASDPTKKAENANADELSPTFDSLSLSPKRLPAVIDISDQLIRQSSAVLIPFLRQALTKQMNAIQEVAFWHGGGTNEPVGVAGTSGIGSVVGGTNGAAPDWADMIDLETAVAIDDADVGSLHYVTNAKVRGKLKKTVRVSSTDSRFVWEGNDINGYMPMVTNAVSSTLTKGTASGVCSAIFFGNLNDFVVGYWGVLDLEIVRDRSGAIAGQRSLVANLYYDAGVLRAPSFAAMLDALTT